jgi:hypothetical protein
LNVAATDAADVGLIVQSLVPLQPPPLHPANTMPEAGVAERIIC